MFKICDICGRGIKQNEPYGYKTGNKPLNTVNGVSCYSFIVLCEKCCEVEQEIESKNKYMEIYCKDCEKFLFYRSKEVDRYLRELGLVAIICEKCLIKRSKI